MDATFDLFVGWLIDGTGAPARRDVVVRVEEGVIESVKHVSRGDLNMSLPVSVRELTDLSHCTLLPGLVDCHVHLTMSGTNDERVRRKQLSFTFEQARPLMDERIKKCLSYGIMALRDGGDSAGLASRYKSEWLPDLGLPMHLKVAGRAWRAKGRYGRLIGRPPEDGCSLAECVAGQDQLTDHVKIVNSGLNSLTEFAKETAPQFSFEELDAAVRAARRGRRNTMVHANGKLPVGIAVEAGCDSIEHGFFMGAANMKRMADLQIFWAPTAYSMKAFSTHMPPESIEAETSARNLDHQLGQISRARDLGVPVVVGTDAGGFGLYHGRAFIEELKLIIEAGFSLEDAVRCASLDGARLLGLEKQIGQIKRGMDANFIAVPGPPSALPNALLQVERVYVRGVQVHG
jgi:imidazolonepropionase-like amidohydrolase